VGARALTWNDRGDLVATWLARVKENVHVVLCFSPMGDAFRNRLRMFPALVNCTTIDWFSEWPAEALTNVGTRALTEGGKEGDERASHVVCKLITGRRGRRAPTR
jgi:dynein heavy chain